MCVCIYSVLCVPVCECTNVHVYCNISVKTNSPELFYRIGPITFTIKDASNCSRFVPEVCGHASNITSGSQVTVHRRKMAAPDELFCWEGDWGLPSVDTDCLVVLVSVLPRFGRTTLFVGCQSYSIKSKRQLLLAPMKRQREGRFPAIIIWISLRNVFCERFRNCRPVWFH